MSRAIPMFASGVVGSMPRSQFVRDLLDPEKAPADPAVFEKYMNGAVDYILAMQEMAGLDIVSDGEYRRRAYIGIIADVCEGFQLKRNFGVWWHTVVAPVKHARPGGAAREAAYLRPRTSRLIKVALPSPYLLGQRMWTEDQSRDAYPTREAFMEALIPILRAELIAVRDAGADIVQFDDPHLCLFVDERVRKEYANPQHEVDLCVDMLNAILDGVNGVHTAIHLCRRNKARAGWVGEGGYGPILGALKRLRVDQFVMEFTIPVAGEVSVLRELPENSCVGLGCVDCRGETIDSVETIIGRVEKALKYLPPHRILLNPDCGFAPGSAADIPIDEAYAKLVNEAEAARRLRERFE